MDEHVKKDIDSLATVKGEASGVTEIDVALNNLEELAQKLVDSGYNHLTSLSAVDYPDDDRFDLYYHVTSYNNGDTIEIKTSVSPRGDKDNLPKAPSLTKIWPMIDWHEREHFDLFGIEFTGHPDLRRILLPEDWGEDGQNPPYPLRKDVVLKKLRFKTREIPKEGINAANTASKKKSKTQ
ncbi:MAG: NADH-quinone oxidoreductase subunit C [Promethearchaeota archaeon]